MTSHLPLTSSDQAAVRPSFGSLNEVRLIQISATRLDVLGSDEFAVNQLRELEGILPAVVTDVDDGRTAFVVEHIAGEVLVSGWIPAGDRGVHSAWCDRSVLDDARLFFF